MFVGEARSHSVLTFNIVAHKASQASLESSGSLIWKGEREKAHNVWGIFGIVSGGLYGTTINTYASDGPDQGCGTFYPGCQAPGCEPSRARGGVCALCISLAFAVLRGGKADWSPLGVPQGGARCASMAAPHAFFSVFSSSILYVPGKILMCLSRKANELRDTERLLYLRNSTCIQSFFLLKHSRTERMSPSVCGCTLLS